MKYIKIYRDNQGSLALTENPELYQRTKYIAVKYYYLREECSKDVVRFWYCPTEDIAADGLTKPLGPTKHKSFVSQLRLKWVVLPDQAEE